MDKRDKMLAAIELSRGCGLEFGPLDVPIVTREMGAVRYADHASTEELKVKNRENPFVNLDRIVAVDYVVGAKPLPEIVVADSPFEYVVASHVIEHVPDPVRWLLEIRAILRSQGVLSLAIPDKRYCFDYYRRPTTAADVLEAYLRGDRKPGFRQLFEHLSAFATVDGSLTWTEGTAAEPTRKMSTRQAWDIAREAASDGNYHDVHCWVFTPATFFAILATLIELDLLDFVVVRYFPTEGHEFCVSLEAVDRSGDEETFRTRQLESLPALHESAERRTVGPGRSHLARMSARWRGVRDRLHRLAGLLVRADKGHGG